jgi:hypothetical protein
MTRMSIDVPADLHQMIKLHAMFNHQTIRDFVVSNIEKVIKKTQAGECKKCRGREVNAETARVLEESEAGIGLTEYKNMEEFWKEMGC